MRPTITSLLLGLALAVGPGPATNTLHAAEAGSPRGRLTTPLEGVQAIRTPLRELRGLRHRLLETSVGRRYAFSGRLELLLIDVPSIWERQIGWLQKYRELVDQLLAIPIESYLADPGTRDALVRAIRWGRNTAIAMPRVHRKGYLKIQPILDGEVDTRPIVGFAVQAKRRRG